MTSVRLPKIGTVIKNKDGSYDVGPFPRLGGPFETATAFFEAWAAHAKFPRLSEEVQETLDWFEGQLTTSMADNMTTSVVEFPGKVGAVANRISSCDAGPFPVSHRDFQICNIVDDDIYNILGVIDWGMGVTVPWELVELPLNLTTRPVTMDMPWFYDEN